MHLFERNRYQQRGDVSQSQNIIKVTLIEDLRDVREGLSVLINGSPGFRCPASFRIM
jgi:hypothetical protein